MKKRKIFLIGLMLVIAALAVSCVPVSCVPAPSAPEPEPRPPVLSAIGNQMVNEGELLIFSVLATDPDGDALEYGASNLPTGAMFGSESQTFSWRPAFNQSGVYTDVRFEVSDGRFTDSEQITITVVDLTLNASVNIDPDVIKLEMEGKRKWVTAYIELDVSTGYHPGQIDPLTVRLNEIVAAVVDPKYEFVTNSSVYITDEDGDGILERMVKFDWTEVQPLLVVGNNTLSITGKLADWPLRPEFSGNDIVEVLP